MTYMWKAAGSPEPTQTASFADVAADAPYASAVSWAVEQGVTKGTSDTAFSPYDTCTRGQIVTFLCRQLDPEAAKAQPAAQTEAPAPQPDTPEAVLAAIQGVWRREEEDGSILERWIEGNTLTIALLDMSASGNPLVKSSTSFTLAGPNENGEYELRSSEGVLHQIRGVEGMAPTTAELSRGSDALLKVKKSSGSGEWIVYNTGLAAGTVYNFSHVSESLLAEKLKALQDQVDQQAAAISKYPTLSEFPMIPDFGAIYGVSLSSESPNPERSTHSSHYVRYKYDREEADARAKALFDSRFATAYDLSKEYADILMECGYEKQSAKSVGGGITLSSIEINRMAIPFSFPSLPSVTF